MAFDPYAPADLARWAALPAERLEAELDQRCLSDGLPVARLDAGAVERALDAAGLAAGDVLADVPPLRAPATAESVAVWTLLAGARPAHVAVVAACVEALAAPELNALGVLSTTGNAALMVAVAGPMAAALGFAGGGNCMGPGCRANAAVGRALSLIGRNVGGAQQGVGDMATMGQPAKYGFCFAENAADSPWEPFHVERGFDRDRSTVTVAGVSGVFEVVGGDAVEPGRMAQMLADAMSAACARNQPLGGGGHPTAVISPEWARTLHEGGVTRRAFRAELHRRAGPAVADGPDDVLVIVAGGVGIKQTCIPSWSGGSVPVTRAIRGGGDGLA